MPVEHLSCKRLVEVGNTDRLLVEDKTSLLVCDVLRGGRVGSCGGASLATHDYIHGEGDRLKPATDSSLRGDQWHGFALEVPLGVLQAHPIYLFIDRGTVGH